MLSGGIAAAAGVAIKKAITDYLELADAVQQFGITAQASAQQASTLIGVARQLGIETSTLDAAFNALKSAVANHPEQFAALDIAIQNVDGSARPLIDVFNELRERLAGTTKDAGTLQVMQELLGGQYKDLLPLLGLTADEMRNMGDRVAELGGVIDEQGIAKAQEYQTQVRELELTWVGFANTFGQAVVPAIVNAAQGLGQVFDTLGTIVHNALGGNFNVFDAIDEAQGRHDQQVARISSTAAAIVSASTRGGGASAGFATQRALADAQRAESDALKDRTDAIKEEADERERAMRKALDAFEEERRAAITTIEDERDRRQQLHDEQLRAIDDETRARQDAFDGIDQGRSDEIDRLRETIRGTQELSDLEKSRADIAAAEGEADAERKVEIFRGAGQSANDYARAVRDQQRRIADADKRVADSKKKLEEDTAKVAIEARVRTIEEERQSARRALDDFKHGAEERQLAIRDQMAAERDQADVRVKQIQTEIDTERKRATDEIDHLQEVTRVTLKELDAQVKAHQSAASAIGAAWDTATRPRTITVTTTNVGGSGGAVVTGSGSGMPDTGSSGGLAGGTPYDRATRQDVIDAYRTYLGRDPEDEGAIVGRLGMAKGALIHEIRNSPEGQAYEMGSYGRGLILQRRGERRPESIGVILDPSSRASLAVHDYPHTMTFNEPASIIGRSGTNYGVIAARGAEEVSFAGVGRNGGGGAPIVIHQNVTGIGVKEAAKLIARENVRELARRAGHGYGRRR